MNELDRIRWQEIVKTIKCAAFCIALVFFAIAGASVLTACGHYQPPCPECWTYL
jgi:hypothetical protein